MSSLTPTGQSVQKSGSKNKETSPQSSNKDTVLWRDSEEYKVVRKLPSRFPKSPNDIYITNKTDYKAQLEKCKHMIRNFKQREHITIHAMGPAINRAINLSLNLKKEWPYLEITCDTSSIELEDDLIPLVDSLDVSFQQRFISAIHIKLSNPIAVAAVSNPTNKI